MHIRFRMTNLHGMPLDMLGRPRHLVTIRRLLRNFQAVANLAQRNRTSS